MEKDEVLRVIEKAARNKQDRLSISLECLESLPPEIGKLTSLNTLLLAKNLLESLPPEIGKLTNLTLLNLYENHLLALPPEIGKLTNLNTLLLAKNLLESLPPEIVKLSTLTTLDLSNNKLESLPPEMGKLTNLNTLLLAKNLLESLPPEIGKLTSLNTLNLSNNKLESLPPEIGKLTSLNTLNLSNNKLESLPPEIVKLSKLTTLDLSNNKLESLPPEIVKLTNLKTLDLYYNKLESLPPEIEKLMPFTKINFFTNIDLAGVFSILPPEILKRGWEAEKTYLDGLKAEKQPLNEVKVLLVGDGGAGKTSLVKKLLGEEFDKHESQTHGINLRDWKVEDIVVHFWDFGGQEIMHATHQFFLSKRSLYILVLDGRRDEKTEYWLKHVESFGGNSPILVVLNKIDDNPSFEVNRKFLQEKYKGIKGFYRVSCANGQGIKDFTGALSKAVANVELIETMWPKTWFNVKTQLEDMTENFISIDKYKEMCTKEKITEKTDQDTLVDFLNDLGVILHFKDFELLDTHVLEPKWVTNAVYKIINSEELAECNGLLRLDLLDRILPQKKRKR